MGEHVDRNIRALHEAAKADRVRIDELHVKLELANQAISSLVAELAGLRVQVVVLLARNGTGSTA